MKSKILFLLKHLNFINRSIKQVQILTQETKIPTMADSKYTQRLFLFPLILLLLLSHFTLSSSETDDLQEIQELMALDQQEQESKDLDKKSEADVLSKAQRTVLELNSDNTEKAIEKNEYVLVLGYAPWCARSAELMPRFSEAANLLKSLGSGILMAKIDSERHPSAAKSLEIQGVPTLVLFVNGSSQPYTGGFSMEEMVLWVKKKTGSPVTRVNSVNEAEEVLKQHTMYAVGLFDEFEGHDYEEFIKAATTDNEVQFVETRSLEIAQVLYPSMRPAKSFFGLVKSEPEQYTSFDGNFNVDTILHFLDNNKFPLVTIMTELNSAKVYSSPNKLQVFVFSEADNLKKFLEPLQDIARKFKSKMMFVAVDFEEDNLVKPFLTLFGLEESKETTVVAFDYNSNSKYLLESIPTSKNIEDFCAGLVQGTQSPYYRSQAIPDNKNSSILTVVGRTFDDVILSSPTNILLEVHTPWCITCESTSKQIEKLAKHFQGLNNLVFARFDASTNEHPRLQVEDYPELLFYPANDKSNPVKLPTKAGLKELAALINKNLKTQEPLSKDEL